jgi:hypothetical protein
LEVFILKNFIFVINKEKIYAYVVSICTIVTLFFMSSFMNKEIDNVEETSTNIIENSVENNTIDNEN